MMNWIIGAVVAAVVVIGGGYYIMSSGSLSMESGVQVATGDVTGDGTGDAMEQEADMVADKATPKLMEKAGFTGSWNDLVKRGGTYTCTVQHSSAVDISKGMVYVSGTDVRGDFTSLVNGASVESHMLKKGDMVYVWGGGMPQGVKVSATMMDGGTGSTAMSGDVVDSKQEYGWDCVSGKPDASKFVMPSNIEFMDVSAMMQGMGSIPGAR
jgi:hypothetical protein